MILKVERYGSNQQWWMFDNIRKVSMSTILFKKDLSIARYGMHDVTLFDTPKSGCMCEGENENCCECETYLVAVCRLTDGSETKIAFDTIAYLLNDNGKTIEKIVANHREPNDPTMA